MYLEVRNLTILYDRAMVINDVSIHVNEGELIGLVGPNGAGKTTLLRAISGLVKWEKDSQKGMVSGKITIDGKVFFNGQEISNMSADKIAQMGLILTPERGRPFREMTVKENLLVGAFLTKSQETMKHNLERVYELFPILKKRENQVSGTVSGGERTMLAIGRSLMSGAKCLLIDEPSVGLAPKVKEQLFQRIRDVHGLGVTMLLTEQDVGYAFDLSKRHYVISQGQIMAEGNPYELLANETVKKSYLGL